MSVRVVLCYHVTVDKTRFIIRATHFVRFFFFFFTGDDGKRIGDRLRTNPGSTHSNKIFLKNNLYFVNEFGFVHYF